MNVQTTPAQRTVWFSTAESCLRFGRTAWALGLGALGSRPVLTVLTDGRSLYSRISDDGLAGGGKWGGWSAACALKVWIRHVRAC